DEKGDAVDGQDSTAAMQHMEGLLQKRAAKLLKTMSAGKNTTARATEESKESDCPSEPKGTKATTATVDTAGESEQSLHDASTEGDLDEGSSDYSEELSESEDSDAEEAESQESNAYAVHHRKFSVIKLINGILASLVAITAGCALYHPWEAVVVGSVGSLLANVAMPLLDRLRVDDPVGAIAVHGVSSVWGMLAVGLFVEMDTLLRLSRGGTGLFRGGGWYLLGVQALAVLIISVWSCVATFIILWESVPHILSPLRLHMVAQYRFSTGVV
ncbi:unnamed protein product, partial [Ixodes pacificus]